MNSEETLEQPTKNDVVLQAIADLSKKIDEFQSENNKRFEAVDIQLEVIRQGIVANSVRFDQLEVISLDAKSIALTTRSQLTILTEEIRTSRKVLV